jgi:hypothetical protein
MSTEAATEERPVGGTMRCYPSGKFVDPANLRPSDIAIGDIVHHLSIQSRYAGAIPFPYSVLEHSLYVAAVLINRGADPLTRLAGLWHDAPEAYLGDMIRPLKHRPEFAPYRDMHDAAWPVIWGVVGMPGTVDYEAVAQADKDVGAEERDWLWRGIGPSLFPMRMSRDPAYLRTIFVARNLELFRNAARAK